VLYIQSGARQDVAFYLSRVRVHLAPVRGQNSIRPAAAGLLPPHSLSIDLYDPEIALVYARAVETIARSGGLVTGRAGGHRPTLPRPPHDFADSDLERCTMTYSGSLPSPSRHFEPNWRKCRAARLLGSLGSLTWGLSLGRERTRPTGIGSRALVRFQVGGTCPGPARPPLDAEALCSRPP
jgi:hypothetical protein